MPTDEGTSGNLPAQNIEAEISVLGSCLLDSSLIPKIKEKIKPGDFYRPTHAVIWSAIVRVYEAVGDVDLLGLVDELKKADEMDAAGGIVAVQSLADDVNVPKWAERHAQLILEASKRRNLRATAQALLETAEDPAVDPVVMAEKAKLALDEGVEGLARWQRKPGRKRSAGKKGDGGRDARDFEKREKRKDKNPDFTEDESALLFAGREKEKFRFVSQRAGWLSWNGAHWDPDSLNTVMESIKAVARERAREHAALLAFLGKPPGPARAMLSNRFVAGVERMARSDPAFAVSINSLDNLDFLLATPGPTIELLTGEHREPRRDDYLTRCTAVAPGGRCPNWEDFILDATGEDIEFISYLKRVTGYLLSGSVREQVAFFFYGDSNSGKSTFVNTVKSVLGSYAVSAPIELLTPQGFEHPTIMAGLAGARMVLLPETEEGRAIAESRFKSLVGGDPIAARYMREDYFTFLPKCKLVIYGNHRPRIRNTDESMRRRLHVVPFDNVVPKDQIDKELMNKLAEEKPGILAWMIEGHREWMEQGLNPPEVITGSSERYFESEDIVGRWINENCVINTQFKTSSAVLWKNWEEWARENGERPRSQRWLSQQLERRAGLERYREGGRGARGFLGIGVLIKDEKRQYDSMDPLMGHYDPGDAPHDAT